MDEACLRLTVRVAGYKPRIITMPSELLAMLSERTRKRVTDMSVDDNQRFKALVEELYIARKKSLRELSKLINVPRATLWEWMKGLSISIVRLDLKIFHTTRRLFVKRGLYL